MKITQKFGIFFAIALIIFAITFPIPKKHIRTSRYSYDIPWTDEYGEEYVGGDAYNYQIEASLKAGYMSGVLAMKSISFVGGLLLLFISLYSLNRCNAIEEQTRQISECIKAVYKNEETKEIISQPSKGKEISYTHNPERQYSTDSVESEPKVKEYNKLGENNVTSKETSSLADSIMQNDSILEKYTVINDKEIKCNKCGTIQPIKRINGVCFKCGIKFSE